MAATYHLKLERFEGPLDLLLHLIKMNEIDIFNIDIFLLSTQYINYLRTVKYDDLGVAGEFLEMAATLIEIKSALLLPKPEKIDSETDDVEDDPRASLQERLLNYERFKAAAEFLGARPRYDLEIRTGQEWSRLQPVFDDQETPLIGDPTSLVILYEQMLQDLSTRKPPAVVEAKTHMVTVEQKIEELEALIASVRFALFQGFYKSFESRYELVVYILAALELSKSGQIKLLQQEINGPLWLYRGDFDRRNVPINADRPQPSGSEQLKDSHDYN